MRTFEEMVDHILTTTNKDEAFYTEVVAWMNESAAESVVDAACLMCMSRYDESFKLMGVMNAVKRGDPVAAATKAALFPGGRIIGDYDESFVRTALDRLGTAIEARRIPRVRRPTDPT
jgi:hypothetical protein